MSGNRDVKGIAGAALIYDYLAFRKPSDDASLDKHGKLIVSEAAKERHSFQMCF